MKTLKITVTTKMRLASRAKQRGLSLVELMIGITLGLLLMAAALQVLMSSRQSFSLQKESANMQENARFVVEMLVRETALAGFTGCRTVDVKTANVINGSGGAGNWQFGNPGVDGVDHTAPNASFPAQYRGVVLPNTDTIIVRGGAGNALFSNSSYASPTVQFPAGSNVLGSGAITTGDFVLASDNQCTQVSIFQASGVAAASISHAAAGTPGNCSTNIAGGIGGDIDAGVPAVPSTCAAPNTAVAAFPAGSNVMPYRISAFYVAPSAADPTVPALWRARVITVGGAATVRLEELLQGVENLQVLYGYDTTATPDGIPNFFVPAGANAPGGGAWNWSRIASIRIAVLLRSLAPTEATAMANANFEGIAVPNDRFARLRIFTTVQLKNHGLQ